MSRLHEIKKGATPLTKAVPMPSASPRQGTRTTKTMAKTARACGHNHTPTEGWRARKQGEGGKDYGKRVKARFAESAKAQQKGDKVSTP